MGHKLAACDGKYTRLMECLDQNLKAFEVLLRIKADMNAVPRDGDDD